MKAVAATVVLTVGVGCIGGCGGGTGS